MEIEDIERKVSELQNDIKKAKESKQPIDLKQLRHVTIKCAVQAINTAFEQFEKPKKRRKRRKRKWKQSPKVIRELSKKKIVDFLADGKERTLREIRMMTGLTTSQAGGYLKTLEKQGFVEHRKITSGDHNIEKWLSRCGRRVITRHGYFFIWRKKD